MNALKWCGLAVAVALAGPSARAEAVLEWAPSADGPWEADPDASVVDLGDGTFRVLTPAEADARFYRLVDSEAELEHCPLFTGLAVHMTFKRGDLDTDGDTVPDCQDLCPGFDDAIDENGNGIPDDCELLGMARIPGGPFEMGDSFGEGDAHERPVHTVPLSTFYLDKCEVTKGQWDEVRRWALAHGYSFDNTGWGKAADHPVHSVSWYDAVKWCNARSEREGLEPCYYTSARQTEVYRTGWVDVANDWVKWEANGYRLPTEAEWEKAARGGLASNRFPWGDTVSHGDANYFSYWVDGAPYYSYDVSATGGYHPDHASGAHPYTAPVGSFPPNGYGLHDMVGNLWEWCWDWYDDGWYGRTEGGNADCRGPEQGSYRVVRGGCWNHDARLARSAVRNRYYPSFWTFNYGFRCAKRQP